MDYFLETAGACEIEPRCTVGFKYRPNCHPARLGLGSYIRSGTVIYADVKAGEHFGTGHNVVIREHTIIGSHVVIETGTVIDGNVRIGNYVKIMCNCYIPSHTTIGDRVFLGPNVVLTNDRYPLKMRDHYRPEGPEIEDFVTVAAGAILCPGITIGRNSFVAAGAVVTEDVPPDTLAVGVPARHERLKEQLREPNIAISWRRFLREEKQHQN